MISFDNNESIMKNKMAIALYCAKCMATFRI